MELLSIFFARIVNLRQAELGDTNKMALYITLWLFNIAMGNGPFIDGLPIKYGDFKHGYVTNNQMVLF